MPSNHSQADSCVGNISASSRSVIPLRLLLPGPFAISISPLRLHKKDTSMLRPCQPFFIIPLRYVPGGYTWAELHVHRRVAGG